MKAMLLSLIYVSILAPLCYADNPVVAIGTFENKSRAPAGVLNTLVDRITAGIVNTKKFKVVDNAGIKELIGEHRKANTDLFDAKGASRPGKFKIAAYVLYGTVLSFNIRANALQLNGLTGRKYTAAIELNVKFTSVETGEIIAAKTVRMENSVSELRSGVHATAGNKAALAVQGAIKKASEAVVEKLMELAYPALILKIAGSKVYVNLTEERVKSGTLLHVFAVGEELTDPDTGETLGKSEELLGDLIIIRTFPKYAIAEPILPLTTAKLIKGMVVRPISPAELEKLKAQKQEHEAKRFRKRF